jgi:hypothetical protein
MHNLNFAKDIKNLFNKHRNHYNHINGFEQERNTQYGNRFEKSQKIEIQKVGYLAPGRFGSSGYYLRSTVIQAWSL